MGSHAFFWVLTLLCLFAFKPYVYGGACSTGTDCTLTKFVKATCTKNMCECLSNEYAPIRTGCGKNLTRPIASPEAGRSIYLFSGTTGTLDCSTVPGAASYAWIFPDATVVHKHSINITKPGLYRCYAISNTESLNSKFYGIFIYDIGTGNTDSPYIGNLKPEINYQDTKIYNGRTVTLSCSGIPMGYSGKVYFVDTNDVEIASSTAPVLSSHLIMETSKSAMTVSCKLDTVSHVTFPKSTATITLPTVVTSNPITAVTLTVEDSTGEIIVEPIYNVGAVGPTLTCTTTPVPVFLDSSKVILYEFLAGTVSKQKNASNTYTVDTSVTSNEFYKCAATFDGLTKETTLTFKIVVSNDLIQVPTIIQLSGDITLNSPLILSCGDAAYTADSYQWSINDVIIERQYDKTIQIFQFAKTDIGVYKCRAVKSRFTTAEASYHAIMKPTVSRVTIGSVYVQGGDYDLKCNTDATIADGWIYAWKKDNNDLGTATNTYTIKNANVTVHNGAYTCISTYNGASSTSSNSISVTVEAAGKRCSTSAECSAMNGYAGACPTATPQVCTCATYFVPRGEVCGLIKPTISRDPTGTVFNTGKNYVLTCNSGSIDTTGWTYAWKKDDGAVTITTSTYTITGANATTHNGSYTCTTTYSTASSTSDALVVSVVAAATAPFINCALLVIMAALGSLFF